MVDDFIEITLAQDDDFLKIKETLTRIGVASRKEKTLYQSCHILHKRGKFYVVHFKELFALDGKPTNFTDDDIGRRNMIANLLNDWGLCKLVDEDKSTEPVAPMSLIKILPYKEKGEWNLESKYSIGKN